MIRLIAVLTTAFSVCFAVLYKVYSTKIFLTLAITFGVTAYHFVMRLTVGMLFNRFMGNRADYNSPWYRLRPWENKLYKALNVKQWKKYLPTYDPSLFDPLLHSWDEIAQAMCQAELVHEMIFALSFLPIVATIWFGSPATFIITSVLAAALDLSFAVMQRYNRPRVIKHIKAQASRKRKGEISHDR